MLRQGNADAGTQAAAVIRLTPGPKAEAGPVLPDGRQQTPIQNQAPNSDTAGQALRQPNLPLLPQRVCLLDGSGYATDYAQLLLTSLGMHVRREYRTSDAHPAIAWQRSGAMALTGHADGPPQMCPFPLASCAEGALAAYAAIAGADLAGQLPGATMLSERAALAGLRRNGAIAPGGGCRLLPAADGWLALSLTREHDWELVPAWLGAQLAPTWNAIAATVVQRSTAQLLEQGRLLGLAVARADSPAQSPAAWHTVAFETGTDCTAHDRQRPLVVDLSSLWAGPLCSHLLQFAGASVIKVESQQRPDGARSGNAAFYNLLNGGKASVALDFASPRGREQLHQLLRKADIVIEASRSRALRQLGVDAEDLLTEHPGLTWVSITGYGRTEPQANWIAYGDDAGVAAGLSGVFYAAGAERLICGDAIADPLTGLHAAVAALASYRGGGGRLIALSLHDVVSHCAGFEMPDCPDALHDRHLNWQHIAQTADLQDQLPAARAAPAEARPLGADNQAVLARMRIAC